MDHLRAPAALVLLALLALAPAAQADDTSCPIGPGDYHDGPAGAQPNTYEGGVDVWVGSPGSGAAFNVDATCVIDPGN